MKVQKSVSQPELLMNLGVCHLVRLCRGAGACIFIRCDLRESKRISKASKGACISCKTPYVEQFYQESGWDYAKKPLSELLDKAKHPITCATCHDPGNMSLRVITPAFLEAQARCGIDMSKATREEMRTYVCAQCHDEYYFEPGTSKVILPWDKGFKEEMYAYYAEKPKMGLPRIGNIRILHVFNFIALPHPDTSR